MKFQTAHRTNYTVCFSELEFSPKYLKCVFRKHFIDEVLYLLILSRAFSCEQTKRFGKVCYANKKS